MKRFVGLLVPLSLLLAAPVRGEDAPGAFEDWGSYHRARTTTSEPARRWLDRGLVLLYSFHHDEAIRSFHEAARLDPACAMAWWGIAAANGPHINFPAVPPDRAKAAWDALGKARALAQNASEADRALIDALATRYADPQPDDRRPLDEAYAKAMGDVARRFPKDADVLTLHAEALMDLQPWDLWTGDGKAKGRADEIVATLERALALDARHPGANHLYVHAVEASAQPERGQDAADRLRTLVPGVSHMVHMPSHIDIRVGAYDKAIEANERAMEVDARLAASLPRAGFYRMYMAHNPQFLAFAAMLTGRRALATKAATAMAAGIPEEFMAAYGPAVDGYLPVLLHVLVRFGRWDDVLAQPEFAAAYPVANAIRRYARGVAFTATDRLEEAQKELDAFDALVATVDDRPIGNNPAKVVLVVPRNLLAGELAFRRGARGEGLARLRDAVRAEDALVYDDPPDWMMPARHPLGAALLEARAWAEAVDTFRADLVRWPENGWSLFGLSRALRGLGRDADAAAVEARFQKAWAKADVTIASPCFCQPGTK